MSPYRALAEVERDPPRRKRGPEHSGAGLVAFLWLFALGAAVLQHALH